MADTHDHSSKTISKPNIELADVFRLYIYDFLKSHKISAHQGKVIRDILSCRTALLGGNTYICDSCGFNQISYNSCKNRHCPKCQFAQKTKWIIDRLNELLPIPYYHAVFTLPDKLHDLVLCNKEIIYPIFFRACAETLQLFGFDNKHLGAQLGFIGILHTWGQTLSYHPHIHFIVTGGGLSRDRKRWVPLPYTNKFCFPVRAMSKVFRGKFIYYLKLKYSNGNLNLPGNIKPLSKPHIFEQFVNSCVRKNWVVYLKKPFAGPESVVQYIGRYTHRVAVANQRLISLDNGQISFRYKDYRDHAKEKIMTLSANEFIRRFLLHIIPHGLKKIRFFGIFSSGIKADMIATARRLLIKTRIYTMTFYNNLLSLFMKQLKELQFCCPKCRYTPMRMAEPIEPVNGKLLFDST